MTRNKVVVVRLSVEEHEMVKKLAKKTGLSMSDVIRQAIRKWSEASEVEAKAA